MNDGNPMDKNGLKKSIPSKNDRKGGDTAKNCSWSTCNNNHDSMTAGMKRPYPTTRCMAN